MALAAASIDAAQALLQGLDTSLSKQWREEDRRWRQEDLQWREAEREFV